jgi:hypothetical protein
MEKLRIRNGVGMAMRSARTIETDLAAAGWRLLIIRNWKQKQIFMFIILLEPCRVPFPLDCQRISILHESVERALKAQLPESRRSFYDAKDSSHTSSDSSQVFPSPRRELIDV